MSVGTVVLERFVQKNPLAVMVRCLSGHLMCEELDQVFEQARTQGYEDQLQQIEGMKSITLIKQLKGAVPLSAEEKYPYLPPQGKTRNI